MPARVMKSVHNSSTEVMPKIKYIYIQKCIVVEFAFCLEFVVLLSIWDTVYLKLKKKKKILRSKVTYQWFGLILGY